MSSKDGSHKAVTSAIISNSCVTLAKFFGWLFSQSPSMLAEAIHSAADTVNQVVLWIGIRHGSGLPTKTYPFGKGRARYIWNLVSAIGIFFIGFGFTAITSVRSFFDDPTKEIISPWILIGILGFSLLAESYTLVVAWRAVKQARGDQSLWEYLRHGDDPTGLAVLLEDAIAVIGVLLAMLGIWLSNITGSHIPDAITAILIACLLGFMAIMLATANGRILMGVAVHKDEEEEIREFVESYPSVERVTSIKTGVMAPGRVRLVMEVEFHGGTLINRQQIERDADRIRDGEDPAYILVETAERMVRTVGREINKLEADIQERFPEIVSIDLEVN